MKKTVNFYLESQMALTQGEGKLRLSSIAGFKQM
jgi:hypothetical protein